MHRTVEAILEADGTVRLLESVETGAPRRALVTLLDEAPPDEPIWAALLASEDALADWAREEEDEAWSHLRQEP